MLNVKFDKASNNSVNVGETSTKVLDANGKRVYARITNDSDEPIYLALGATAEVGKGIRINATGGYYEISYINPFLGEINGIHDGTGNKRVSVVEA